MNAFFLFQTGRMLIVLVCLLAVGNLLAYRRITANPARKWQKWMVWIGLAGATVALLAIIALHYWRIPRGLSAQYYANSTWTEDRAIELDRYFEADGVGKRVDRFIDFNPNDFNDRYPFSGKPFTVKWEGWLHVPADGMRVSVHSNFDSWLSIDGALRERRVNSPNALDIGAPEARPYLGKKGWSFDEQAEDGGTTFAWAANDDVEVILGVDEVAEYELSFRCLPFAFPGSQPQQVRVAIEKKEIGAISLSEGWQTYTMPISAALIEQVKTGSLRIVFTFSSVAKPADVIVGSNDARELAAAFDKIELRRRTPVLSSHPLLPNTALAPGIHAICLEAKSLFANPCIQLRAEFSAEGAVRPLPEDLLFPVHLSREALASDLPKDRMRLNALEIFEILTILLLAGALGSAAIPFVRQPRTWISRDALVVGGICLCAFVIRLLFIVEMKRIDSNFYILPDGTDHQNYWFFARGFLRGYWPSLTREPFFQAPMISFYFIACSLLFGESMTGIRVATACLATLSVGFTFLLARRVFGRAEAYLAAILCACNGALIFYDTSLLLEPLLIFLSLLALWLMLQYQETLSRSTTFMLGIVIGLIFLTRSTFALFLPFFMVWMLSWHTGTLKKAAGHFAVMCLLAFFVILPVSIRNYYSRPSHPLVLLNTNGGVTFWIGNNASSSGMYAWSAQLQVETQKRMRALGTSYVDEVIRFVKEQPMAYLRLEMKKFKLFWRGYEIGNNIPYYIFRYTSRLLRLPWINFLLIAPLGIIGMCLTFRQWKEAFLLYGYVFAQMMATLLFFALARYRLPVVHVLTMFAAVAVWRGMESLRRKQWGTAAVMVLAFVVLYVALNYPDAARFYKINMGSPMPLSRLLRYWDLFYTW